MEGSEASLGCKELQAVYRVKLVASAMAGVQGGLLSYVKWDKSGV